MDVINSYFKNLVFTKVDEKQGFIIYGAGVASGLGGGSKRYVLLFVPSHLAFTNRGRITDLPWQNLQTRQLTYSYRMKSQHWALQRDTSDFILEVKERHKNYSSYACRDLPFEILLLHDPQKKTLYQYRNRLTLAAALGMFNTVVNYVGETAPLMYMNTPDVAPPPVRQVPDRLPHFGNWFGSQSETNEIDDSYELL